MSLNSLLKNADGYALAFQANDITSEKMRKAIAEWFSLYYQGETVKDEDSCQQIPYTIVRKLTKTVFAEYEATSKDAYTDGILASLAKKREEAMQAALIGGESVLKPIPEGDGFRFLVVPRNNILVFAKDADGNATDVGMAERVTVGNAYYTLLERRTVDAGGYLTIKNRLFRSYNGENLGQEVPLNSIPQYEQLEPEYTFNKPVDCVGLVSLHTPIRTIDYESGVHTSIEAAVRRNIMGGLGIMQEKISQQNHDDLGCDGWELSAHAGSAPDHEPYQGKQYTDEEYTQLNNSLVRRIGTLHCGHGATPIILGVNFPQYTEEELEKFRKDNESGVDFDGKHYTKYEATQKQRSFERAIRSRKREILVDEALDDKEKLKTDQIKEAFEKLKSYKA